MNAENLLPTVLTVSSGILGHRVEAEQNFFAVGGDSLLSIELLIALESELSVEIDEDALFEAESFRDLAQRIGQGDGTTVDAAESEERPK